MTKSRILALALAAAVFFSLASCQEFFTSSWGGWAERDASVPSGLTADQAMDISDTALLNRDTDLARALLPQMAAFLAGSPSDALAAAAVDTAVLATGIDEAFGKVLKTVGSSIIDSGAIDSADYDAVAAILASVTVTADGYDVFNYINTIAVGGVPALVAAGVTASDCALAAAGLLIEQANADGQTLQDLLDGTATLNTGSDNYNLAQDLLGIANTLDSSDPLYSLANGWL